MVWAVPLSTMKLIPHSLTPRVQATALVVWLNLVSFSLPSSSRALPPQLIPEAAPKCISGRTSYLQVRLAFYLYPQFIPQLCHVDGFGPSPRYYQGFTLTMGSSPGFGSTLCDIQLPGTPYSDSLSLRLHDLVA